MEPINQNEFAKLLAELAVEQSQPQLPAADAEVSASRNAIAEAAGVDLIRVIRWISDNRDTFSQILEAIKKLVAAFQQPQAAGDGPEAIGLGTILMLANLLAPLVPKILDLFRKDAAPAPTPAPAV